jgi:hypothetical protein
MTAQPKGTLAPVADFYELSTGFLKACQEISMKRIAALFLLSAALGFVGPASAEETQAQTSGLSSGMSGQQHEMSSRHRHRSHDRRVAVSARACPGFTVAPIAHKVYGDKRWPYVSWIGACDSLYAPGPLVTFVRYQSY